MADLNDSILTNESTFTEDDDGIFSISKEAYEDFDFASNVIATPVVCVFGVIGNSLSFGALYKDTKRQKLSIYIYLCGLTIFDITYLLFGLIKSIPYFIDLYDKQFANYIEEHMKLGTLYVDLVLSHTSNAVIILMSLERLLALVCPLTVKTTWLSRFPVPLLGVCFFINVIFLIPYAIYFEVSSVSRDNVTIYFLKFQNDAVAAMNVYVLVQAIVDYIIPMVVVLFINTAVPIVYYRAMKRRRDIVEMAGHGLNNQQTKITATVFYITLMYFLLSLPKMFILVLQFFNKEYSFIGKYKFVFWLFRSIGNLFSFINAANDFVIYVLVSNQSRKMFVDMYCRCVCCKNKEDPLSMYTFDTEEGSRSNDPTVTERY